MPKKRTAFWRRAPLEAHDHVSNPMLRSFPVGTIGKRCTGSGGMFDDCRRWNQASNRCCRSCGALLVRRPKRKKKDTTLELRRERAHRELLQAITRMKRTLTSIELWRRRISYFERAIDERDHPRPPRPPRTRVPQHRRRTVLLPNAEETE